MTKLITVNGVGPIRVPEGTDNPDIPRDLEWTATDLANQIAARVGAGGGGISLPPGGAPGQVLVSNGAGGLEWADIGGGGGGGGGVGGRMYYEVKPTQSGGYVESSYTDLGLGTIQAPTSYDWICIVKAYLNFSCSGITGAEKVRMRFGRTKGGAMDHTGFHDTWLNYNSSEYIIGRTYFFTGDRGGTVEYAVDRTSGWTCSVKTKYWGAWFLEQTPDLRAAVAGFAEPLVTETEAVPSRLWTPRAYRSPQPTGEIVEKLTDLQFLNDRVANIGNLQPGLTPQQEWGPAWATGESTTLGDGSKAYWNGTQFVAGVAP